MLSVIGKLSTGGTSYVSITRIHIYYAKHKE
jgi:hypothetical protein